MDKKEINRIIAEQIINMWENNILHDNGFEGIVGWLEDGDLFIQAGYDEEETNEIMEVVKRIQDRVDDLSWILATEKED
jgi:hypothetical protein